VKIYINGHLLGEQFARRNLSAPVNPQLVRLYDIAPYLTDGPNVLAVEAHNYGTLSPDLDPGGPARCGGFHLYGELATRAGTITAILSDTQWRVADQPATDWTSSSFADANWPRAKADPKPTVWVTYPDFVAHVRGYSDVR